MTKLRNKAYGTQCYLHVFRAYALGGSLFTRQQFPPFPSALGLRQGQVLHQTSYDCGLVQISICHHSSQQTGMQQTGGKEGGRCGEGVGEKIKGLTLLKVNIPETVTTVKYGGCMEVGCSQFNFREQLKERAFQNSQNICYHQKKKSFSKALLCSLSEDVFQNSKLLRS